ncbi:hypothetical protein HanIR_Chr11g0543341 [Helianthus annuus]|nr:hypothetical protein HanIR_Chr11g0543341 [Helianthus annuus]
MSIGRLWHLFPSKLSFHLGKRQALFPSKLSFHLGKRQARIKASNFSINRECWWVVVG